MTYCLPPRPQNLAYGYIWGGAWDLYLFSISVVVIVFKCRKINRRNQSVCPARKSPMVRFTKSGLRTIPNNAHPFCYRILSRLHLSTSLCKRPLWKALHSSKRVQKAEKFIYGRSRQVRGGNKTERVNTGSRRSWLLPCRGLGEATPPLPVHASALK